MNVGEIFIHMVVAAMGAVVGAFLAVGFFALCYMMVVAIKVAYVRARTTLGFPPVADSTAEASTETPA